MTNRINLLDNYIQTNIHHTTLYDTKEKYDIYNLNGQKMNSSIQLYKGIYIKDKKKIVVH
jgi:hypothetical protein